MRIMWNEQSVRWFQNASRYTGFHRRLARLLLERIPRRDSLCDVGCGAGLVDFELAPHFQRVTCVDRVPQAVQAVQKRAGELGLDNLTALCLEGQSLTGQWGTVTALFHGGLEELPHYVSLAQDRLILVTHGSGQGSFGPAQRRRAKHIYTAVMQNWLEQLHLDYRLTETELEYGQPFTDLEDARAFLRAYVGPMEPGEMEDYLGRALQKTGDGEFPYYLPNQKNIGIFTVEKLM
ncbi:MAG: methyltransferase domain-containing protein [Oscillospiraceae bacterium]|nr:methyltransferase domain-containing protein [Oscillospiraceae bacterium]